MKLRIAIVLVPFFSMMLWACPFVANVPVAMPKQAADKIVFGDWKQVDADSLKDDEWTIEEHEEGAQKYRIDGPEGIYDGWITAVGDKWFLSLCDPAKLTSGFMLFRVDKMSDQSIELMPISGKNKQYFSGCDHLQEWIAQHMNENSFYDQEEKIVLVRIGK